MDKAEAVKRFVERLDNYPELPFLTEGEVEGLFGEEVMSALRRLLDLAREIKLCSDCGGKCCAEVKCELYSTRFEACPIHELRPVACRFHFCHRFGDEHKEAIVALRDIYLGCFMTFDGMGSITGSHQARSLDTPPLANFWPELSEFGRRTIAFMEGGDLTPEEAQQAIREEIAKYRQERSAPYPKR